MKAKNVSKDWGKIKIDKTVKFFTGKGDISWIYDLLGWKKHERRA